MFPRTIESSISTIFLSRKFSVISPNFLATPSFRNLVLGCIKVLPTYLFLQSTSPYGMFNWKTRTSRDFFWCSYGLKFSPIPNGIYVTFFTSLEKKNNRPKKKIIFFENWDFHSVSTHTTYMVTFSSNNMCNS